jgi:hypothetical protein
MVARWSSEPLVVGSNPPTIVFVKLNNIVFFDFIIKNTESKTDMIIEDY